MTEHHDHATIERLTRAELKRLYLEWDAVDRGLTERLAQMFLNGQSGAGIGAASDRDTKARARAAQLLNGHGKRVLGSKVTEGQTEVALFEERQAVRVILASLTARDTESAAIEAQKRAEQAKPAYLALVREWLAAAQKFAHAEQRAQDFLDALGGGVSELLPLTGVIGCGAQIEARGRTTLDEIVALAKAAGIGKA